MSRVNDLYKTSENLLKENKVEIETTENNIAYLKSDKAVVEEELTEAKKQVELLSSDLKKVRQDLNKETLKFKRLSKERKVLVNTVKVLKPTPTKKQQDS